MNNEDWKVRVLDNPGPLVENECQGAEGVMGSCYLLDPLALIQHQRSRCCYCIYTLLSFADWYDHGFEHPMDHAGGPC